ncbi:MAG TPA: hypothetical protein DEA89_03345 [Candidatus Moranbacteria bacterium]|nr:hypothetical protein [Candidatus Moranbacteria bacterium]HBU10921.1 hypothetical protein [Candidatus Moranbacteria bacterium]
MSELMLDVGQANEIKLAARRAGATNADLKRLSEGDVFAKLLPYLRGMAEVVLTKHIIDCDAEPFIPDGLKVEKHCKDGQFEWDIDKVSLHLSKEQACGNSIEGNKLRKKLEKMPILNANVLDYLLKNSQLIPEDWKGKAIFFWGTIYRRSDGGLYVRCLYWRGGQWDWFYDWLGHDFNSSRPALLRAS